MTDLVYAVDVSGWQPRDLSGIIAAHDPGHVLVKLYLPWENVSQDHSRAQVGSTRTAGRSVGGYGFCYRSSPPDGTVSALLDLCASMNLVLPILWLDCETATDNQGNVYDPGPDAEWLRTALATARALETRVGFYTAHWWVRDWFPGGYAAFQEFADVPIWLCAPGTADLNASSLPGFPPIVARQWSITDLDRDVLLPEFAFVQPAPPPPPPPRDPCAWAISRAAALNQARLETVQYLRTAKRLSRKKLLALTSDPGFAPH